MSGLFSKRANTLSIIILMTFCLLLYNKDSLSVRYSRDSLQYMPLCSCYRDYRPSVTVLSANISLENTTCSEAAYYKGDHQKVISFTYYEAVENKTAVINKTSREYFRGIKENLKLVKTFYPGYNMRLYYQVFSDSGLAQLCQLGEFYCMELSAGGLKTFYVK